MDDIEELLVKLKPVIGHKKARSLWRLYSLGDKDRKQAETFIRLLGDKHLGRNYQKDVLLLEPPGLSISDGDIYLGDIVYGDKILHPFFIKGQELLEHCAIFGRSGSGKTNIGYLLLDGLLRHEIPFMVFDWKKNYRPLLNSNPGIQVFTIGRDISPFFFNPLIPPPGTAMDTWLRKIIEIICLAYFEGAGVAFLLLKGMDIISRLKSPPRLLDVLEWLEKRKSRGREAQWLDSAKRAIASLCYGSFGKALNEEKGHDPAALLKNNVIFEMDALSNADKIFFIQSLLLWIHHFRLSRPERNRLLHVILIEEAHHILLRKLTELKGEESVTDVILREIRELGEGIVLIDQHPSLISKPALANTYTTIAMNAKHMSDVRGIAESMALDRADMEHLTKLPVGSGIVRLQGRWMKPFLVRFFCYPVEKNLVSDQDLKRNIQGYYENPGVFRDFHGNHEGIRAFPGKERREKMRRGECPLGQENPVKALLQDAAENPFVSMVERYGRLELNAFQGNRAKQTLLDQGFAKLESINTGKGRKKFLVPTERGIEMAKAFGGESRRLRMGESFEHQYWKHVIAELARKYGWNVEVEKHLDNGKIVDLVLTKNNQRMAVQVETGKSTVEDNIEGIAGEGIDLVLMVDTKEFNPSV